MAFKSTSGTLLSVLYANYDPTPNGKSLNFVFWGEGPSLIILTSEENDARVESTKVSDWIISEEVCPSLNNLECHAIHLFRVCWSADKEEGFGVDLFANLFFCQFAIFCIFRLSVLFFSIIGKSMYWRFRPYKTKEGCKKSSKMEVAPRYTLFTLFYTVYTVHTIQTVLHCLNCSLHACIYC